MPETFRVPRSRANKTHQMLRDEIMAALEPILFDDYRNSYAIRAELEAAFAAEMRKRHAVAAHSGTIALLLALRACGIGPGDQVITVGNSDISTTGAISQCGAIPVLCDVARSDYTIDVDLVEDLITGKTRAILPVDLHGHPANVRALRPLADRHDLKIVEDAALASGACDHGAPVGAFADVAMFSFAPFKPLGSAGNGAMLVTSDDSLADQLRLLVSYGHAPTLSPSPKMREGLDTPSLFMGEGAGGWGSLPPGYQNYIAEGYNVPLDGLQAALLLVKLPYLGEWTRQRRDIVSRLEAGLADTSAILPRFRAESRPTFRSYAIAVDRQGELHQGLRAAGIEAVIHYAPPIYEYDVYAGMFPERGSLTTTERLARQIVNLPVTPELTSDDVDYMIEVTRKLLNNG